MWQVIETKNEEAQAIMDKDAALLDNLEDRPILHLYEWSGPSATYGYFVKPEQFLSLEGCESAGLKLAKRPTGGGIIFHTTDLAFSVLVPSTHKGYSDNTLENYAFVNNKVRSVVGSLLKEYPHLLPEDPSPIDSSCARFCMAKPTIYDVMLGGRKVAGAAQRKKKQGYLHQGSISITMPDKAFLERVLRPGTRVADAMGMHTFELGNDIKQMRSILRSKLTEEFL